MPEEKIFPMPMFIEPAGDLITWVQQYKLHYPKQIVQLNYVSKFLDCQIELAEEWDSIMYGNTCGIERMAVLRTRNSLNRQPLFILQRDKQPAVYLLFKADWHE